MTHSNKNTILLQSPEIVLVTVNFIAFVAIRIAVTCFNAGSIVDNFAINASGNLLQLPWTLFSYMFVHVDFTHMLFNMAVLFVSCSIIRRIYRKHTPYIYITYIASAITGAFTFILFAIGEAVFIGASCGVMGIVGLMGVFSIKQKFSIPIIGRINQAAFTLILVILHLALITPVNQAVGVAHATGMITGVLIGTIILIRNENRFSKYHQNDTEIKRINLKARNSGYSSLTDEERQIIENNIRI